MQGNYYDPDTNPTPNAYKPCAQGILLNFDPVVDAAPVIATIGPIGSLSPIQYVSNVSNGVGPNDQGILVKVQVPDPPIDQFTYQVHNSASVVSGKVSVYATMAGDTKHVYIEDI
jgi:hypothetical protein